MKNRAIACARRYGRLGVALVWALLCACGRSGDLYLPSDDAPARSPEQERTSR